jgi:hypothetical protein
MNFSLIAGWDYRFGEQILRECSAQQLTRVPAGSFPFSREQREGAPPPPPQRFRPPQSPNFLSCGNSRSNNQSWITGGCYAAALLEM